MTIKRRLFISNILMLILPVVITTIITIIVASSFMGITGIQDIRAFIGEENISQTVVTDTTNYRAAVGTIIFAIVLLSSFFTNLFLNKFVFKHINNPIETLSNGVHQIRDGNLDYKIKYENKDEFKQICDDFNEMALRLSCSVCAKQKDENNRKELIAGISHDLLTPLTSIKAYVEGLEKGVVTNEDMQKRYYDTIKNKIGDLEHIINKLFLFSKLDIGEFPFAIEKINIANELSIFINQIQDEYTLKGLNITLIENCESVFVNVDVVQIRNALLNILENSVKYKVSEQCEMKIRCKSGDKFVKIILEDDGVGVPNDSIEKLFDVFYRSDQARTNPSKGSGLGLAITSKIIERLGGTIHAKNVSTGGLSIIITLPKIAGDEQA